MKIPLEIKQLGDKIKDSLPDKTIRVIGEVSQPKIFRGNVYLSLKDNYCNIKSIIWKSKYEQFKSEIKDGDKIVVKGKLDFYGGNGTISFIIEKLLKHDGEGELFKLYQKYKKDFENKGYFLPNEKLNLPKKIEKILLLTSEQGAAIQDFIYALENNHSKLDYDIIDVPVQGNDCPGIIIQKLLTLDKNYDVIVITRGGGSFEDLFGFSQPDLVETVHNLDQPVLSAIGHQVDTSLLDLVADCCSPTPSLAAQYIIDVNKKFIRNIEEMRDTIKDELLNLYNNQSRELNRCNERLNRIIISYDRVQQSYHNELLQQLNNYSFKLKELDLKLSSMMEKKDNTIIIKSNDKIVTFEDFEKILDENEDFTIKWKGKEFKISDYICN
jgi:exodeoxyribonuclease VII large subunit